MDTTPLFHLPFGDMTITPLDFTTINGLSFSGESISVSNEAHSSSMLRNRWLKDLFRATVVVKSS